MVYVNSKQGVGLHKALNKQVKRLINNNKNFYERILRDNIKNLGLQIISIYFMV